MASSGKYTLLYVVCTHTRISSIPTAYGIRIYTHAHLVTSLGHAISDLICEVIGHSPQLLEEIWFFQ